MAIGEPHDSVSYEILQDRTLEIDELEEFIIDHYGVHPHFMHYFKHKVIDFNTLCWVRHLIKKHTPPDEDRNYQGFFNCLSDVTKLEDIRDEYMEKTLDQEVNPNKRRKKTKKYPIELEL